MTPPTEGDGMSEKIATAASDMGIDLAQFEIQQLNQAWVRAARRSPPHREVET
jgi:hypothetical protein